MAQLDDMPVSSSLVLPQGQYPKFGFHGDQINSGYNSQQKPRDSSHGKKKSRSKAKNY